MSHRFAEIASPLALPVRAALFAFYAGLILAIGYLHYFIGFTPDFTTLYLIPIVLSSLQLGFRAAAVIGTIGFVSDLTGYGHKALEKTYVDAALHYVIFLGAAYVAWRLRKDLMRITKLEGRLRADMEIAKQAQQSLFTEPAPRIPGFDVGVKLVFSKAVGGDFYDMTPLGGSRVGLIIADISGKSLSAALYTALLKENWLSATQSSGGSAEIVDRLNSRLIGQLPTDMFVTLFCAVIETNTGKLEFVNAGHEPGLLLIDGHVEPLVTPGQTALGVIRNVPVAVRTVAMSTGSILLLHTDGLIEPPATGFDSQSMVAVLEANAGKSAQAIAEAVYNGRFGGHPEQQRDDVTILCLKKQLV